MEIDLREGLHYLDIACRTGLHCAPLVHESLGTASAGSVRFSIGPFTTPADVEAEAAAIRALAEEVRGNQRGKANAPVRT